MLHMSLSLTILYFSAAIKLLNTDYDEEHEDHESEDQEQQLHVTKMSSHTDSFHDEKYLCVCMTISLLLIYLMRLQHKGLRDEGKLRLRKWSYAFKVLLSILCSGVPWVAKTPTHCVAFLFTITGLLIIQDLVSHEGHLRVEEDHESVKSETISDPQTFFERSDHFPPLSPSLSHFLPSRTFHQSQESSQSCRTLKSPNFQES
jgi:hypothetical protein